MFRSNNSLRTRRKKSLLHKPEWAFDQLEIRRLLAQVIADFRDDFPNPGQAPDSAWSYQWNAPNGWSSAGHTGDTASAPIHAPQTEFVSLRPTNSGTHWTADGDLIGTNNASAGFLRLNSQGGTAGPAGSALPVQNQHDRYAIASYTVSQSGYYTIDNSFVDMQLASQDSDGVEFRVFANRHAPVEQGVVKPGTRAYFDTEIGFLVSGDTIHVAFGANDHQFSDNFLTDFSILVHPERELVVGNYRTDFSLTSLHSQWRYLWNAPVGWVPNGAIGNLSSGAVDDTNNYRTLMPTPTAWTPDGNTNWTHVPDYHLRLTPGGGLPGLGTVNGANPARYSIAAFTVKNSGLYGIQDSFVSVSSLSNDGIEIRTIVNDGQSLVRNTLIATAGQTRNFDIDLGYLKPGDTVYVAFGANRNHISDSFQTDFSIVRLLPRPAPNLDLLNTTSGFIMVDAIPNDDLDDWSAINSALQFARTQPGNFEVRFAPGVYNISVPPGWESGKVLFELVDHHNTLINGGGAEIIVDDYAHGLFAIHRSSNVLIANLKIDYSRVNDLQLPANQRLYRPLTFTQGTISSPDPASGTFILTVDTNEFVAPDSSFESTGSGGWGFVIDSQVPGRLKYGTEWHYPTRKIEPVAGTSNQFRVSVFQSLGMTGIMTGDRYVLQRRINRALIGAYNNSQKISVVGVTAWTAPAVFVASVHSSEINVINSHVAIRPGTSRWASINADGVHLQSNRVGGWIQGSTFNGLGDDVMNFYALAATIHQIHDAARFTIGSILGNGLTNTALYSYQIGDRLSFMDPVQGIQIREVKIIATELGASVQHGGKSYSTVTITVDQPVPNLVPGNGNDEPGWRNETTVFNTTANQGFLVQGNVLSNSRRYGNFLMANNGWLVDNAYTGLSDQAIAAHSEHTWPIGLFADDILVQGNKFTDIGFSHPYLNQDYQTGAVGFYMDRLGNQLVDRPELEFSDIQIRDNVFYNWRKSAISVRNTQRATIANNVILAGLPHPVRDSAFEIVFTRDVRLENNAIADSGYVMHHANNENLYESGTIGLPASTRVWLTMDQFGGSMTPDRSGQDHPGTLVGNPMPVQEGVLSNGVQFEGTGGISVNDGVDSGVIELRTVSLWIKPTENQSGRQVIYEEGSSWRGMNIYLDQGRLYVGQWNSNGINSTFLNTSIEFGKWNHVALVLDASVGKIRGYLNGEKFGAGLATGLVAHGGTISMGRSDSNGTRFHDNTGGNSQYELRGIIDDFRVYDSALADAQISVLAHRPKKSAGNFRLLS